MKLSCRRTAASFFTIFALSTSPCAAEMGPSIIINAAYSSKVEGAHFFLSSGDEKVYVRKLDLTEIPATGEKFRVCNTGQYVNADNVFYDASYVCDSAPSIDPVPISFWKENTAVNVVTMSTDHVQTKIGSVMLADANAADVELVFNATDDLRTAEGWDYLASDIQTGSSASKEIIFENFNFTKVDGQPVAIIVNPRDIRLIDGGDDSSKSLQ